MNLYGSIGSHWWIGVVENRLDPLKLGRCQVRIFGYHTDDTVELPAEDLPWAVPITPITSGAISGIGAAPVGPLEGTWVVGVFLDGDDKQQPLMLGTINSKPSKPAGIRQKEDIPENALKDSEGNIVKDSDGNPILVTEDPAPPVTPGSGISEEIRTNLPPLSVQEIQEYFNYISENTEITGITKYKFSINDLINLGYLKNGSTLENLQFTNKNNINSLEKLVSDEKLLDKILYEKTYKNYKELLNNNTIKIDTDKPKVLGYLLVSHVFAPSNAGKSNLKDDQGIPIESIYSDISKKFNGDGEYPKETAGIPNRESFVAGNPANKSNDPAGPLNDPSLAKIIAYQDPNKVYPKKEYLDKPDTNKLATGDKTSPLLKNKEKKRIKNITIANSNKIWNEPEISYSGKYPYNQVMETESGHVVEFDNTPGGERIHVYHKEGTYLEIDVNGTMIKKVVGDTYEVHERNGYVYVKGAYNLTTEGTTKIQVKDSADIQVFGETKLIGHKSITVNSAEFINLNSNNGINLGTAGPININSGDKINIRGADIIFEATENTISGISPSEIIFDTSKFSINSADVSIDGIIDLSNDTATEGIKTGLTSNFIGTESKNVKSSTLPDLVPAKASNDENNFAVETPEDNNPSFKEEQIAKGEMVDSAPNESEQTEELKPITPETTECSCEEFAQYKTFPDTLKLSKYFTLGALTTRCPAASYQLVANKGLSKAQIACNLKTLAVNCLDVIKDKYPDMIVTNAFRAKGTPSSDHETGCAADLQFKSHSFSQYYEIVQWIYKNIPNTQVLLEYQNKPYGVICWIHIAYDSNSKPRPLRYATFYNHAIYKRNQFVNLA